jgi:hypothetical protein
MVVNTTCAFYTGKLCVFVGGGGGGGGVGGGGGGCMKSFGCESSTDAQGLAPCIQPSVWPIGLVCSSANFICR